MSDEGLSARGAGQRYVADSTVGGIRRAARPGILGKLVWGFFIVGAYSVAIVAVVRLRDVRSERSVSTEEVTSRVDDARGREFPAVTVCNVNPVKLEPLIVVVREVPQRKKRAVYGATDHLQMFSDFIETNRLKNAGSQTQEFRVEYQNLLDKLILEQRLETGHAIANLLTACRLGYASCDASNFTQFYHHKYGNCYTFLADPLHNTVWSAGPCQGLTLDLATDIYSTQMEDETGFVVAVHGPRDWPFLAERGAFVPIGNAAYIAVTTDTTSGPAGEGCNGGEAGGATIYSDDPLLHYSQTACQHSCLQRELYEDCGCCHLDLPCPRIFLDPSTNVSDTATATMAAAPRCSMDNATCVDGVVSRYIQGNLPCLDDCKPVCSVTSYSTRTSLVSSTAIPTEIPPAAARSTSAGKVQPETSSPSPPVVETQPTDTMTAGFSSGAPAVTEGAMGSTFPTEMFPSTFTDSTTFTEGPTGGQFRKKRQVFGETASARVHVYFEDLKSEVTESTVVEAQPVDWAEWMADIGGIFSLWVGLSFLGVLEIGHLVVELCMLGFSKCSKAAGGVSTTPVKPLTP